MSQSVSSHPAPDARPDPRFTGKGDLSQGDICAHLVRLSVPMIWGILAIVSIQLIDTFYISLLGTQALAAISFTFPVTMTVFSLIIGLGIGMSSILARRIGAADYESVMRIATHGLFLAALIGSVVALIGLAVMKPVFRAMGADATTLPMIVSYMGVWFAAGAFIAVPIVGNSAIRATGDTLSPSITMMCAAAVNALVTPLLVFGLGPFPRLEMQGAAVATLFSYIVALGMAVSILYFKKKLIFQGKLDFHLFGDSAKNILHVGLPAGISGLIQPLTHGVMTAMLAAHGMQAVAAYGVATRVEAFAFVIIMALATGMSPILGQNHGAGHADRVRETLRLSLWFCVLWSLFVAAVLTLFAQPIAALFSADAGVVRLCALYFWIVPFSYAAGNLVQGWASAFNALGQPRKALTMTLVRLLLLQIPLAALLGHFYGAIGVFAAIAGVNLGTGIYFHLRHWPRLSAYSPPANVKA